MGRRLPSPPLKTAVGGVFSPARMAGACMRHIFLMALLLASSLHAQTLYKCVSKSGGTSFQQQPCPAKSRVARTIYTQPVPPMTAVQLRQLKRKKQQDRAESAYLSHLAGTDVAPAPLRWSNSTYSETRASRCAAAKAFRDQQERQLGLKRNYDILRALQQPVNAACNGP